MNGTASTGETTNDRAIRVPAPRLRRLGFLAVVASTMVFGMSRMLDILDMNGMSFLGTLILILFGFTFTWIAAAFWSAVAGFVLSLCRRDPLSLRPCPVRGVAEVALRSRTAVVMPVYDEETSRVLAGLEATYRDLQATGAGTSFDFYLLSDTTDPEIAVQERWMWRALQRRSRGASRLFYRRRARNEGRKPGNLAEFCRRWGGGYDYMVVLDADSIMTGRALVELARVMEANPSAGIIQTVPCPVRQETLFGRLVQFAADLYSPMLATGLSFWQMETANYWGHNAIVRVRAFTEHCGLPSLPGEPPLGGEILSHDFVEAALIRRGGWEVYLLPELEGSYEEVPSNVLDYAARDRRWAEGNLQHTRLLAAHGLHPLSRLHFLMGAFAYTGSFLWLLALIAGTVDAVGRALTEHEFFHAGDQLFPDWPVAMVQEMVLLVSVVVGMLVLPKAMGVVLCLLRPERRRVFGGAWRVVAGAFFELVFSVILAPVMMSFHAWFVVCILRGRRVNWGPQVREGRHVPWTEALRSTWLASLCGLAWGIGTWWVAPVLFWVLSPVVLGLVLAAPVVSWSSRPGLGWRLRRRGLLSTPSETEPLPVLRLVERLLVQPMGVSGLHEGPVPEQALPPERPLSMPLQRFDSGPRWDLGAESGRFGAPLPEEGND